MNIYIAICLLIIVAILQVQTSEKEGFTQNPVAVYKGSARSWKYMYRSIGSGIRVVNEDPGTGDVFYGSIDSKALRTLDDKVNFAEFMDRNNLSKYHPKSYNIRTLEDVENTAFDNGKLYYVKDASAQTFGGHGIEIMPAEEIRDFLISNIRKGKHFVVQQDATNGRPLLYDGRKGDFRFYLLLVLRKGKLEAYLYQDGFLKQAPEPYRSKTLSKKVLLTNNTQRSDKVLDNKLVSALKDGAKILAIVKDVLTSATKALAPLIEQTTLNKDRLQIQVCGTDMIFDAEYQPYLLEMNINNPAYYVKNNNKIVRELKSAIGHDIVDNFIHSYFQTGNFNLSSSGFIKL